MLKLMNQRVLAFMVVASFLFCLEPVAAVPKIDHEANCTYKELTWDDFRGPVVNGQQAAWIRSTVMMESFETKFISSDEGYSARAKFPAIYAYMDKLNSGVRTGARNEYTLNHEQRHFDITEIHAREFVLEMATIEGVGVNRREASDALFAKIESAYQGVIERLARMQHSYDGETVHGLKKKQQKKWAEKIDELLLRTQSYPLL